MKLQTCKQPELHHVLRTGMLVCVGDLIHGHISSQHGVDHEMHCRIMSDSWRSGLRPDAPVPPPIFVWYSAQAVLKAHLRCGYEQRLQLALLLKGSSTVTDLAGGAIVTVDDPFRSKDTCNLCPYPHLKCALRTA